MLEFPQEYFKREIRDGFAVGETVKRSWAAQLEVLTRIIDICEKHHITYYMFWGSLIGTVRHKGFIPWDDDLDIAMLRDDYIKFLSVAKSELPEGYQVRNFYTESDWTNYFSRVTNSKIIDFSDKFMTEYHEFPYAAGVDIFPLYYIPHNRTYAEQIKVLYTAAGEVANEIDARDEAAKNGASALELSELDQEIAADLVTLEHHTGYKFTADRPLLNQCDILMDQIARMAEESESDEVTAYPLYVRANYRIDRKLMEPIAMPFENLMVTVPVGYDAILRKNYRDYMVPVVGKSTHEYPFFRTDVCKFSDKVEFIDMQSKLQTESMNLTFEKKNPDRKMLPEVAANLLPTEWYDKIYYTNEQDKIVKKPVILYYPGMAGMLNDSANYIEKLRATLHTFKKNKDVVLWWFPCSVESEQFGYINKQIPELLEEYRRIIDEFIAEDYGIYDMSGDISRAVNMSDAYYGDKSAISPYYEQTGKPMMYLDYQIIK